MSSLGEKVKNILHKDNSNDDTSPHPPGSFPTEDMEPSETTEGWSKGHEHEHNKLHKADDPRGWTESERDAARTGHGYKDSGVGMTGSNDRTGYNSTQEPMSERRDEPLSDRRENTLGRTNEVGAMGAQSGAMGAESRAMGQEDPLAPSTEEHPYWGDLPSQGGVHNSVVGHGSPEDEARRHQAVHAGATEPTRTSGTLESGTFLSRRNNEDASRNTEPYGSRPGDRERPDERTSGSHFKEDLAGAGATGGAAYGAHELNKRHRENEEPRRYDQTTDRTQPEEHKQRAFPLLGKDHKEPKEHKESHHHEKVKEDKHKDDKESKLSALLHHKGSKDENERAEDYDNDKHHHSKTGPALAAAGAAGAGGAYAATRDRHDNDNLRDNTTSRYQEPSATQHTTKYPASGLDSTRDYNTQSNMPSSGGTVQKPYRQEDINSQRGSGLTTGAATGAAAGLGAGALASHHGRRDEDRSMAQPTSSYEQQSYNQSATSQPHHQQGSGHMHGLSAAAVADYPDDNQRYDSQGTQPANFSHKDPVGQTQQHDSHRGAGLAAGTAAGLGAGAMASRTGRDHDHDEHSGLESNRGFENQSTYPTEGSTMNPSSRAYEQQDAHRGTGFGAGTAAGLGAGALGSHTGRDRDEKSGLGSNRAFNSQDPYSSERSAMNPGSQSYEQQDSHRGMGLGAGTAAGVGAGALASRAGRDHDERSGLGSNRGLEGQDAYSSERSAMNPGSQSYEQQGSHRGAGLASGAAAGMGAGTLASHAADHRRDNDQLNMGDNSRDFQSGNTSSVLGNTGSGIGNNSGMDNTSGFDSSNKESMLGSQRESEQFTERKKEHDHTLMDNANSGKYNKLSSGTPSA
ncbi:hypothetical protein ACLX1H_000114 [Fusarium chlamydosporum]